MQTDQDLETAKAEILEALYRDRELAHKTLFPHRHKNKDPEFHAQFREVLYSEDQWAVLEAFRGGAKSTQAEERIIIGALFEDFRYAIIVGNSYDRACERLAAIKNELNTNDNITEVFGLQSGGTWAADQVVLANGCKIQAFGARQSLRGAKHNDQRPDFCLVDDLEDEENVATEDARRKLKRWFNGALIPAMDPQGKIRMLGTPLHPKSLLEEKMADRQWRSVRFPVMYLDDNGVEVSAWPDRFSLEYLNKIKQNYVVSGSFTEWEQEYMCRSEDVAAKPFQASMIKNEVVSSVWMPVKIMVDPARTTKVKTSARTGYAVWSWMGPKLIVHEAFGAFHKPDEIINTIFELDKKYNPVEIGVERDGLEEFILQPLRTEMLRRGYEIPLTPMKAPRNKEDFIKGLQPFYNAGEVIHAGNTSDLVSELLQFPSGRVDVPNALAYALKMRVGKAVYEDFGLTHISPTLEDTDRRHAVYLAVSARPSMLTGVLMQYINGRIVVYKDWVKHGPPMEMLQGLVQEAIMFGGSKIKLVAPKEQFDKYTNNGLRQAARELRLPMEIGGASQNSHGVLTKWLCKQVQGIPSFTVSDGSRWVLNGLSNGYARKLTDAGLLSEMPEQNIYAVVMEAVECFVMWFDFAQQNNDGEDRRYDVTSNGRQYLTARSM
jgi:hypothetical protein